MAEAGLLVRNDAGYARSQYFGYPNSAGPGVDERPGTAYQALARGVPYSPPCGEHNLTHL